MPEIFIVLESFVWHSSLGGNKQWIPPEKEKIYTNIKKIIKIKYKNIVMVHPQVSKK